MGIGVVIWRVPSALEKSKEPAQDIRKKLAKPINGETNIPIKMKHIASVRNIFASWQSSIKNASPRVMSGMSRRN